MFMKFIVYFSRWIYNRHIRVFKIDSATYWFHASYYLLYIEDNNYCEFDVICDLCGVISASVGRVTKFLGSRGTPLLTTGGFTFDFQLPKVTCAHEFYMLLRLGLVGFRDIAYFLIDLVRQSVLRMSVLLSYSSPTKSKQLVSHNKFYITYLSLTCKVS